MASLQFVTSSLETIAKDAHRNKQLSESVQSALAAIKESDPQLPDPEIVFAPLQLATKSGSVPLITNALDSIGKLTSSSYFSQLSSQEGSAERAPLIERAIDTICDCFQGETTHADVQLQIVKSLLAAVLNDKIIVHGAGLLKAVRQVYNVFLLSRSPVNQQVAQGTLTQMAGTVFERVKTRLHMKESRVHLSKLAHSSSKLTLEVAESVNGSSTATAEEYGYQDAKAAAAAAATAAVDTPEEKRDDDAKLTLKDLEKMKNFDDSGLGDGPTMVSQVKPAKKTARSISEHTLGDCLSDDSPEVLDAEDEVYIRDAYLVFRSFCNLSTKVLSQDQLFDLRGQAMRSKLISLHLIHTLLHSNISVFVSPLCTITNTKNNEPTSFLEAIKYYLCLSITRNGASSVDKVFDVTCEVFWLILKYMRASFKKEIEVVLNEIYLALLARRNAPLSQKLYFVGILNRLCADPRALVEVYLNYDCDRNVDNIYQTLIEDLSRFATAPVAITPAQEQHFEERHSKGNLATDWQTKGAMPPPLSATQIAPQNETESDIPKEYAIKRISLDSLVEALRSLVNWSQSGRPDGNAGSVVDAERRSSLEDARDSIDPSYGEGLSRGDTPALPSTPVVDDDPEHLEKEKARKTAMTNAIKVFNFKPKKGVALLLKEGFIPSDSPEDIAKFLIQEERLDKAQLGEYLGEGDPKNIEIMHAFVDTMDFTKRRFVDALRQFLQSFRLPGEAQKIDRFMLKFANRYVMGNPNAFANADTAYVLAYSVIMLNTDLHSSKIAKRMSKEDFIKNNRGINDNADLPEEYLVSIYDEIASNEIVLTSERQAAAAAGAVPPPATGIAAGIGQAFSTRDYQREAYVQQSEEISLRSEQLFKNLFKSQRRNAEMAGIKFIPATSFKHVGPMFDVAWMSFFSALSSQLQKAFNIEVIKLCLEGMKLAIKIACLFDLPTPREAFISAVKNTANLNNPTEVFAKNLEALRVLLELGYTEGNYLRQSWKDILMCVSQLERLQLMAGGVDANSVPDVSKARFQPPAREGSVDSRKSAASKRQRQRASGAAPHGLNAEVAYELLSDDMIKSMDRIFTNTANLNGEAIAHFARALTEVSWDEIKVSGSNDQPRMYSLQKIVEISYYNMTRVRFEWTTIWDVLGDHFNNVGCHINEAIVFFALDSLRQLSMRFMEIEELPGFKFQKDFLKPFEHVMSNSSNIRVKDMVLRCLIQMIQARGENIRSGWRTMFGVFTIAARDPSESIVSMAYENVTQVYKTRFGVVISQGAFTDLIVCLTEFSKNIKFQKKSLQAMETLKSIIPRMLKTPECPLSRRYANDKGANTAIVEPPMKSPGQNRTSVEEAFWFPVLFAFHDVLMTGEDLEVRSNALNYFFEALLRYGGDFPSEFWDTLWRQQLYPIFMVLRSRPEMSNVLNHEELSVWLSTTMIQALRNMITLFTHYFEALEYMLDRFLELLALCICQENDTIARIGSNCLQQLILQNVTKFNPDHWAKIVGAFCELFERTTAYQLFSATTINSTASLSLSPPRTGIDFSGPLSPGLESPKLDEKSLKINGNEVENGYSSDAESGAEPHVDGEDPLKTPTASSNQTNSSGTSAAATTTTTITTTSPPLNNLPSPVLEDYKPSSNLQQQPVVVTAARRRFFNRIISRCVLQLLMIETVNELFSNEAVYAQIPSSELLRLMGLLKKSFLFARRFNNDKELRMRLWREGFMKQPPNLLKQESGSAATYIAILFRMFADQAPGRRESKADVENALVPLCKDIIRGYISLEEESQHRNILAWRPVVVDVLEGYAALPEPAFRNHAKAFYPLVVDLVSKELSGELRNALLLVLRKVGEYELGIEGMATSAAHRGSRLEHKRRDSVLTMSTEGGGGGSGPVTVEVESGDASTRFMGRGQ